MRPLSTTLALTMLTALAANAETWNVYVGTYTSGESEGIYRFAFDDESGEASPAELAVATDNPSFLAGHPSQPVVYATARLGDNHAVSAFQIDKASGKLVPLNHQPAGGRGPCHVAVTTDGKFAAVANYGDGTVSVYPVAAGGTLGEACAFFQHTGTGADPKRQTAPHAHSVNFDATGQYLVVADLGIDKLMIYKRDGGTFVPNDPPFASVPPGGGPRHFAFHPSGNYAYAVNEMGNTVTAFTWNVKTGTLMPIHTVTTLPEGYADVTHTADIEVHPSGKFVYASNRGHDSIAVFSVDQTTGKLTPKGQTKSGGVRPRNFSQSPNGKFLLAAHQDTHDIFVFAIDQQTGALTPTGAKVEVSTPVCLVFAKP
ncbi:MAG: lactonase family protein [Candidatus Hydrogenedentes bacterium]|nr:lactonase family protein [Candidatus Hydrogenedentota bacterium]